MKVAIDARMIRSATMHGIARYVYELLLGLRRLNSSHEFLILVDQDSPLLKLTWTKNFKIQKVKAKWISFREQWEVPWVLLRHRVDLFHAPSFVAPLFAPCKLIMTIHDLNHMVLPQFYTPLHQFYYQFFVRRCIAQSEQVLTVSQFSKAEIIRNLNLSTDKVTVTYNGVSEHYAPVRDGEYLDYVRDLYDLPGEFIFCLSNNKPHKNVHQLLRAYCYSEVEVPLVLACPADSQSLQIAENHCKKHLIYFSKFIDEEHLPAIYSMTSLFVYPSTYEGFGLPPLEALACGAPVVVARASSLPEVVGDCAIFTNPFDFKDIALALQVGLKDLAVRNRLRVDGLEHARHFSWQKMTRQTLAVYDQIETHQNRVRCEVPS